jgi:hypothetical protein
VRNVKPWLASALMAALVSAGVTVGQPPPPPPPGDGPVPAFVQPGRLGAEDMVERIMAFDKNKDGKVTRDELPERMHDLIARGDTNKDGALDRDEIKRLVATLPAAGPGGPLVTVGFGVGPVTVGPGPGAPGVEGVVDDLKLSGKKKDQAMAAAKAHQENVRKLMDQARADLLREMKGILSEEEFNDFKAALDRPGGPRATINFNAGPPDVPRPNR